MRKLDLTSPPHTHPALAWPCRGPRPAARSPSPSPPSPPPACAPLSLSLTPPHRAILSSLGPRVQPSLSCSILFTSFLPRFVFRFSHLCAPLRGTALSGPPRGGLVWAEDSG